MWMYVRVVQFIDTEGRTVTDSTIFLQKQIVQIKIFIIHDQK